MSSHDYSLPYLIDQSDNLYDTADQLSAGGWLFDIPFFAGRPVAQAGFGTGFGSGMETGSGLGTGGCVDEGIGMSASRGTSTLAQSAGQSITGEDTSWAKFGDGKLDLPLNVNNMGGTMPGSSWNGVGLMGISSQPSPLDFPYPPSVAFPQSSATPSFHIPLFGNGNGNGNLQTPNSALPTRDPVGYSAGTSQPSWDMQTLNAEPLDLRLFSNFPSRSIPTGARYDQLLQAKLGSPTDPPNFAPQASMPNGRQSYPTNPPPKNASDKGYNSLHPRDGAAHHVDSSTPGIWLGSTAPTSGANTPNQLVPSQANPNMPLPSSIPPPSAQGVGPYSNTTSRATSPNTAIPQSLGFQSQHQQQGSHLHPNPLTLPYYPLDGSHMQQIPGMMPGQSFNGVSAHTPTHPSQNQGQAQWGYQQQASLQRRDPSHAPAPFSNNQAQAGSSRAASMSHASRVAPPAPPVPLVSHHSDPQVRPSQAPFPNWQQSQLPLSTDALAPASAPLPNNPSSYRSIPPDQYHPKHYPLQNPSLPQFPNYAMYQQHIHQSLQIQSQNSSIPYPASYPHYPLPGMPTTMQQPWTSTIPSVSTISLASNGESSLGGPSTSLRPTAPSRSRSSSVLFEPSAVESPLFEKDTHETEAAALPKPQRKRRRTKASGEVGAKVAKRGRRPRVSSEANKDHDRKPKAGASDEVEEEEEEEEERKVVIACHTCRAKKLKCDGARPRCHNCHRKDEESCSYDARLKRRGQGKKTKEKMSQAFRGMNYPAGSQTPGSYKPAGTRRRPRGVRADVGASVDPALDTVPESQTALPILDHPAPAAMEEAVKVEPVGAGA